MSNMSVIIITFIAIVVCIDIFLGFTIFKDARKNNFKYPHLIGLFSMFSIPSNSIVYLVAKNYILKERSDSLNYSSTSTNESNYLYKKSKSNKFSNLSEDDFKIVKKLIICTISIILSLVLLFVAIETSGSGNLSNQVHSKFYLALKKDTRTIKLSADETVTFTYDINITKGDLDITLEDSDGNVVKTIDDNNGKFSLTARDDTKYKLIMSTSGFASGSYSIEWNID